MQLISAACHLEDRLSSDGGRKWANYVLNALSEFYRFINNSFIAYILNTHYEKECNNKQAMSKS